jgi:hypothetical protein
MIQAFSASLAHLSETWQRRLFRLRFWPRHSHIRITAQEALAAADGGFQALHVAYATAAAHQETQARRLDLRGDFFMLVALVTTPVSLIITVLNVANGAHPLWFLVPFICFFFPTMLGLSLWFNADIPDDIEIALRHTLPMFGGLQHFPASIWATHNSHLLLTFPVFQNFFFEFLHQLTLSSKESEVFHQLLADGYEGSLADLIVISRSLAK